MASVGAQTWIGWRDRRTNSIASARIVYSALGGMTAALRGAQVSGTWGVGGIDQFDIYVATWEKQRDALARATSSPDYHVIQVAFYNVQAIASARTRAREEGKPDEGVALVLNDSHANAREDSIDRGRVLAFAAGERWSDKLRRRLPFYKAPIEDILSEEPEPNSIS